MRDSDTERVAKKSFNLVNIFSVEREEEVAIFKEEDVVVEDKFKVSVVNRASESEMFVENVNEAVRVSGDAVKFNREIESDKSIFKGVESRSCDVKDACIVEFASDVKKDVRVGVIFIVKSWNSERLII